MKRLTTIICMITFALAGYFISLNNDAFSIMSNAKSIHAAETPQIVMQYPKDLLLGHKNNVGLTIVRDTVRDTIPLEVRYDTVTVVKHKTKIKWRTKEVFVPDTIASQAQHDIDTLYVSKPVLVVPAAKEQTDSISL